MSRPSERALMSFVVPMVLASSASAAAGDVGQSTCSGAPHSLGVPSVLRGLGSNDLELNALSLECTSLPPNRLGYFLVSRAAGFVANPAGSAGNLCLGGAIGRYSTSVLDSGVLGRVLQPVDLQAVPQPNGAIVPASGDTLHFQFWHRDSLPGGAATSNFSPGLRVTFCSGALLPGTAVASGDGPLGIASGDLDQDGDVDLVLTTVSGGIGCKLVILRNQGNGLFPEADSLELPQASCLFGVVLSDYDGDGLLDIVANSDTGNVQRYKNLGGAVFASPVQQFVSASIVGLASGDLDGDGDEDLVAQGFFGTSVAFLRNLGGGAFAPPVQLPLGFQPRAVLMHDLDVDGDLDLVVPLGDGGDGVALLFNDGLGGFGPRTLLATGAGSYSAAVGDIDGDLLPDLVVTARTTQRVRFLRNLGGGTFAAPSDIPAGFLPFLVALGDVDGDGDLDLLVGEEDAESVQLHLNRGGAGFAPFVRKYAGLRVSELHITDLDGDGRADVVVGDRAAAVTTVLLFGDAAVGLVAGDVTSVGGTSNGLALADLDGDGDLDLAATQYATDTFRIALNQGSGVFQVSAPQFVCDSPLLVRAGDLDSDGDTDLVVVCELLRPRLLRNQGGTFVPEELLAIDPFVRLLALGDADGDGDLDIAVHRAGSATVDLFANLGTGSFVASTSVAVVQVPAPFPAVDQLVLEDLDGDGDPELAVASLYGLAGVQLFANLGGGVFSAGVALSSGTGYRDLSAADLDLDGDLDLAAVGGEILVLEQTGALVFGLPRTYSLGDATCATLALADVDLDGAPDVVCSTPVGPLAVSRNHGDGTFEAPLRFAARPEAPIVVGDLDADGDGDVAQWVNSLVVLRGRCR